MARLIVYYAHPGQQFSRVNKAMAQAAEAVVGVTFCDLYGIYPRFNIDIDREQEKLLAHDVILFQHPLFWYSTLALVKEWIDLVLEHGFAYGSGGTKLTDKILMNAITAAGPEASYTEEGSQHQKLRTFLTPLEQTAHLCRMKFAAPYVLFSSLKAKFNVEIAEHVKGYRQILEAIRDDRYDFPVAIEREIITCSGIPLKGSAAQ